MQLLAIACGLDPDRYTPLVVLPERGELAPLLENAGVEVEVRPLAVLRRALLSPRGIANLAAQLRRDARALEELVRPREVALVHSNTSVVLSGQSVAERIGAPHVVHVREIYTGAAGRVGGALWPVLRRRLERADARICVSSAVAGQFRGAGTVVVHDAVSRQGGSTERDRARAGLDLPGDRFVVTVLGRVSERKGQDVLARALADERLAEIGAIGLVAGAPFPGHEGHERALAALAGRLELGGRFRFLGFRGDVATVLAAADAVVIPSTLPESFPNAALDAAAAGIPVVGSAAGGLPEIVSDHRTGRLVEPGDHRALAAALRGLADDPQAARRMADAASDDVRARFPRQRMLQEIQACYERVVAGRAGGAPRG